MIVDEGRLQSKQVGVYWGGINPAQVVLRLNDDDDDNISGNKKVGHGLSVNSDEFSLIQKLNNIRLNNSIYSRVLYPETSREPI